MRTMSILAAVTVLLYYPNPGFTGRSEDSLKIIKPTPQTGTLILTSTPPGAMVFDGMDYNNKVLGITPCTLKVAVVNRVKIHHPATKKVILPRLIYVWEGETEVRHFDLRPDGQNEIVGDLRRPPEVKILGQQDYLAPTIVFDGGPRIHGTANNVDIRTTKVRLWAKTDIYYPQGVALIGQDGSWETWSFPWHELVALLVDSTYSRGGGPNSTWPPSEIRGVIAWDEYLDPERHRYIPPGPLVFPLREIDFSSGKWSVRHARWKKVGPGPNYFSSDKKNVWADSSGLHLKITKKDGSWLCAEVFLQRRLGYGIYTVQLASLRGAFSGVPVAAVFLYGSEKRRADIEFSQFFVPGPHNAQYVVQASPRPDNQHTFSMPYSTGTSTHRVEWRADRVVFMSWRGWDPYPPKPEDVLSSWTYIGPYRPSRKSRFHINYWLPQGAEQFGEPPELTIRSFSFQP